MTTEVAVTMQILAYRRGESTPLISKHVRTSASHCKYMLGVLLHQLQFEVTEKQINIRKCFQGTVLSLLERDSSALEKDIIP